MGMGGPGGMGGPIPIGGPMGGPIGGPIGGPVDGPAGGPTGGPPLSSSESDSAFDFFILKQTHAMTQPDSTTMPAETPQIHIEIRQ